MFPTYFVRIPTLKLQLGLSDQALGLLLTLPALSAVIAMQVAGRLVSRFGSSAVLRVVMVALPLTMLGLPLAGSALAAGVALSLIGMLDGLLGIGMNTHAVTVERRLGRPIMSGSHAAYSLAAVVAATLGGFALRAATSSFVHFAVAAAIALTLGLVGGRAMLPASADRLEAPARPDLPPLPDPRDVVWEPHPPAVPAPAGRGGWTRRVVLLGAMATVVLVGESAVGSWSGVYLHEELDASLAAASAGYIGFSICHAGGRLVGDRLETRFGPIPLLQAAGIVAGLGLATVVVAPVFAVTVLGFALFGLGLSVLLPVILRMAGHEGAGSDHSGAAAALAHIGTLTYAGMLLGPVVVGWLAQWIGLRETFAGLLLLLGAVFGAGRRGAAAPVGHPTARPAAQAGQTAEAGQTAQTAQAA